ncbi:MAG TPA: FUSC family protein [Streptosporangiaceae bacterium]
MCPGTERRGRPAQLGAAARAVAQRAPETLTIVRYRAQPKAVTIARLASTAILAYLLALQLPAVTARPVLAPLTALLVAQVTLYQTVRSAIQRVVAVVAGVLLAVGLSAWVGFTWWSLGLTIVVGLAVGYALRLGETLLEVPISAMLILSVGTPNAAATGRIVETLVGAGAGLLAGFIYARPRVEPAAEAIAELCRTTADLLAEMATGLSHGTVIDKSGDWLARARSLGGEIQRVEDSLRQAEESVRLNPRAPRLAIAPFELRRRLETLEHSAVTVRVLARSLADSARLGEDTSPMRDQEIRWRLSATLSELAAALRDYSRLTLAENPDQRGLVEADLRYHLDGARRRQDQLSELLGTDPAAQPVGWPLRGELVSHLDRLRTELEAGIGRSEQPTRRHRLRESLHTVLRMDAVGPARPRSPRKRLRGSRSARAGAPPATESGGGRGQHHGEIITTHRTGAGS